MIHQFDKKKRILFFPTGWANSVASWCAGVSSPTGTVRIKNTLTPKEGGVSLEIDINEERIASLALQAVENRTSFSDTERNLIKGMFQSATDQKILVYRNDLFGIDMDALRRNLGLDEEGEGKLQENQTDASTAGKAYDISTDELLASKAPNFTRAVVYDEYDEDGVELDEAKIKRIGTSSRSAREDHTHPIEHDTTAAIDITLPWSSDNDSGKWENSLDDGENNGWTRNSTTYATVTSSGDTKTVTPVSPARYCGVKFKVITRVVRAGMFDYFVCRELEFDKNGMLRKLGPEVAVYGEYNCNY